MKKVSSIIHINRIERIIYIIRGHKVMLDRDLAELYGVETKVLNQAVKRNIERFPKDFMFQLNVKEVEALRSQFVTLNITSLTSQIVISKGRGKHRKYLPYAFTEQGVAMLSSVLRSPQAIAVNIEIMRAFVRFRHVLSSQKELTKIVTELRSFVLKKSAKTDQEVRKIWQAIEKLTESPNDKNKRRIGFSLE